MPLSIPPTRDRVLLRLSQEFDNPRPAIERLVSLLDDGYGVPFIAYYRNDGLDGMNTDRMYEIRQRLPEVQMLEEHKAVVLETAERQGALEAAMVDEVLSFHDIDRLEDWFQAWRHRNQGKAAEAQRQSLGPLAATLAERRLPPGQTPLEAAEAFVSPDKGLPDARSALEGAKAIVAERIGVTKQLREAMWSAAVRAVPAKPGRSLPKHYESLARLSKPAHSLAWHETLLLRKAAREGYVTIELGITEERAHQILAQTYVADLASTDPLRNFWDSLLCEAWVYRLHDACERELQRELKNRADRAALRTFIRNYRELLMGPWFEHARVCGITPAIRKSTRCSVIDENGKFVAHMSCLPLKTEQRAEAAQRLRTFISEHAVQAIALGAGPGCREIEHFLLETFQGVEGRPQIVTVSEEATLALAKREHSRQDLSTRKAAILARRLQDPLLEWARIEPAQVPLGPEMDEVHQGLLTRRLEDVRAACLHSVGFDLARVSTDVLALAEGMDKATAQKVIELRDRGRLPRLGSLLDESILEPKQFEQVAPFLRLDPSIDPLDATRIEPRLYRIVEEMAASLSLSITQLLQQRNQLGRLDLDTFVREDIDRRTIERIVRELRSPKEDPRPRFSTIEFDGTPARLEDVTMGMELTGRVTRLAEFGAFVDVGVAPAGLLHVSQMSDHFVGDPSRIVKPGQVVQVRVLEVNRSAGRLSLTMRSGDIRKVPRTLGDMAEGKRRPGAVVVPHGADEKPEARGRAAARPGRGGRGPRGPEGGPQRGRGREGGGRGREERRREGGRFRPRDDLPRRSRGPFTVESEDIQAAEQSDRGHKGELKSFAALASMMSGDREPPKSAIPEDQTPEPSPEQESGEGASSPESATPSTAPPATAAGSDPGEPEIETQPADETESDDAAASDDPPSPDAPSEEPSQTKPFGQEFV